VRPCSALLLHRSLRRSLRRSSLLSSLSRSQPGAEASGEAAGERGAGDQAGASGDARLAAGDYACSFGAYPEFLCRVTEDGDFLSLEKLGGSERFSGSLSRDDGGGVRFTNGASEGTPAELLFVRQADGSWFAAIPADGETIGYRLRHLGDPGSQFGGQAYAGAIGDPTAGP
jgi:hypothetical protein